MKRLSGILIFIMVILITKSNHAQVDSIARSFVDTVIGKLIDDDIPRETFRDKMMYSHRWYVKQIMRPKITDFDSSYITSNKRRLTITIPVTKKYYGFNLKDLDKNKELKFSPNNYYHVGFFFSNIILTFGVAPAIRFGAKPGHGKTISRDLQLTIIGRRVITDINFQNYKGFYVHNSNEYNLNIQTSDVIVRPEIKVISFGVNTMFVYNHKKYSLRGAFSFTDVQRKSAGSFMTGLYHSHVVFSSKDSTFVNYPFKKSFSPLLYDVNNISVITMGISGGYGYTYVLKKVIFSTAVNVGIGGTKINYTTVNEQRNTLSWHPSTHINAKAALRYDNQRFFVGTLAVYDNNFTFNPSLFNTENYIAKVVLFVGYRFNIKQNGKKVLKAMGLIDYKKNKK